MRARELGQLLVVSVGTDTVGVTNNNGVAVFRLELNDLLVQSVRGLHTFGLQAVFAKGEQHVGSSGRSSSQRFAEPGPVLLQQPGPGNAK